MISDQGRRYVRDAGYVTANLGEELAVLDMASGSYLGFNSTAAEVWRLLETPQTLDALCVAMVSQFEVQQDRCRAEISTLLDRLCAAGLVLGMECGN